MSKNFVAASDVSSVELFAGAGGLALGTSNAGFRHRAVLEKNSNACATLRVNRHKEWRIIETDVRCFDFSPYEGIDLISGGPPCQPFSIGGRHRGPRDGRNLFPEVVRAVRETRPKAILVENVRGLLRPNFSKFFEYVILQLTYPEIGARGDEDWTSHLSRLERHHTEGRLQGLTYRVVFQNLNAADFGVPQKRQRVFIVGVREDIHADWSFPTPTHSEDALLHAQWVTKEYWERHRIATAKRPAMPDRLKSRIAKLRGSLLPPIEESWLTVRDAVGDLPDPRKRTTENRYPNHDYNPGAKVYAGHNGSPIDEPAKTLKAGDHGVPGGENMVAFPNGEVRYFTVRESARLQTFPDDFEIHGSWTEAMRQLGNAVPVRLAQVVAKKIHESLNCQAKKVRTTR